MSHCDLSTTSPRIGYVAKVYPRFSETFVVNEIRGLEGHGAQLNVFSLRPPTDGHFHASLAAVRAPVEYLDRPVRPQHVWQAFRLAQERLPLEAHLPELLAAEPDEAVQAAWLATRVQALGLCHLHAHFGSVATTVARLAARIAGVTYSFTAHAKDIFHTDVDHADLSRKLADAAAVVTVSDYNVEYLTTVFGADPARVQRIYNGLDLDEYRYTPDTADPDRIVAVGRLVEKKGFGDLLHALARLAPERPSLRLDLVGTGPLGPELQSQVSTLGLDERVQFHGPQPQDRVRELVRDAAVFAAPCVIAQDGNRDGLPTVLVEAMALGTPVVTTPVTGNTEVVRHQQTGLVVPESDPEALAGALADVLDHPEQSAQRAAAARALVEERFDAARTTGALWSLFRRVTGQQPVQRSARPAGVSR